MIGGGRILPLDFESTGVDTREDRIVTCFIGLMEQDGSFSASRDWVIDPGVPIPAGAAAVHGWTTERVQAHPGHVTPDRIGAALEEIDGIIRYECVGNGVPLVIYNAQYDLTLLDAEMIRHLGRPLSLEGVTVVDPLVVDKGIDKYRKGSRKLVDAARHYGLAVDESKAHDASYDCYLAGNIALRQLRKPQLARANPADLMRRQAEWKREQSISLENYFRTKAPVDQRDPKAHVDREWPIVPINKERAA